MNAWKILFADNVLFIYAMAPVIWRYLEGKLKNEKAFALAYVTGFHLVLASFFVNSMFIEGLVLLSYLIMLALTIAKIEIVKSPYLYLLCSLVVASKVLGWSL